MLPVKIKLTNAPPALVLVIIVLVLGILLYAPIFTINALNLLFGTEIPVNFWTWLSMFWLHLVIAGRSSSSND